MSTTEVAPLRSEEIQSFHRERLAVVYVRQSTPQQVLHHQESTRLQYGLKARAIALGWPEQRVLIIDEDLGKSGSSAEGRAGFQRLVAEVGLDHVGIILGIEVSRLARSCRDWHHLLEICALFGTLIADLDGVYAPRDYNDRLLLGLKGTMSEAELHIMHQRMVQGKLNKARRGELGMPLPAGYTKRPSGEIHVDPDEQAQNVVRLVFRKFEELGTLNAVLRYMVALDLRLGIRTRTGPNKGELQWPRPNRQTLRNMLHSPFYAGAYAYGRREVDPRRKKAGRPATGRTVKRAEECAVLLKEHHPAYISWEQYERNVARLAANQSRSHTLGAVRHGPSLLAGLLACGRCGCRLTVGYGGSENRHSYICSRRMVDYGEPLCQHLAGAALDAHVVNQVLATLTPAALELSLEAAEHVERDRAEVTRLWCQRLERAAYVADRVGRHCRAVEPENRLVARQFEREWEEALTAQRALEEEFHRFESARPKLLTAAEREAIRCLASDIPALWSANTTTAADRKAIIRQVIDRIVVETRGESEHVDVSIQWAGGTLTEGVMIRPVRTLTQLSTYPQLCERIQALASEGLVAATIAARLNDEGFRPPKQRESFVPSGVRLLMRRLGVGRSAAHNEWQPALEEHEWLAPELARHLDMPVMTLHNWVRRGWLKVRHVDGPTRRRLVIWADEAELNAIRERRARPQGYYTRRRFLETEVGEPTPAKGSENNDPQE